MRAYLPAYDLRAPETMREVLALLADRARGWRPLAGGTDLMVLLEAGKLPEGRYVGLWKLTELRGIHEIGGAFAIGALTTYTDVIQDARLAKAFPLLGRAAAETGGVATQNRGTLGGNIANASPAADTPPALLVYDAELELQSVRGTRRVPYDRFHRGYKEMDLGPDELITRIHLPRPRAGGRHYYRKVGTRRAQAISKVCLAAWIDHDPATRTIRDVRIAVNSVAPMVKRCHHVEDAIRGRVGDAGLVKDATIALARDIAPIDDVRSTARYRQRVAVNLLEECLEQAI
ncbi:MAG TPA: xanthine dehydrogenase family protein subunit M [Vicinamibacterales bacterium]|nr:xanthine dehydrogenase family protein subunit M [Vicinamibacterales bacterium]